MIFNASSRLFPRWRSDDLSTILLFQEEWDEYIIHFLADVVEVDGSLFIAALSEQRIEKQSVTLGQPVKPETEHMVELKDHLGSPLGTPVSHINFIAVDYIISRRHELLKGLNLGFYQRLLGIYSGENAIALGVRQTLSDLWKEFQALKSVANFNK